MTKKQKMKRKRILQRIMPVIIAVILIVIVLLVSFGNGIFEEYGKSQKKADMNAYFGLTAADQSEVILNGEYLDTKAKVQDGKYYLPLKLVNDSIYDGFYYDSNEDKLLFTTAEETMTASTADYIKDGDSIDVSVDYVKKFVNMSYSSYDEPARIVIATVWNERDVADISKDTALRVNGDNKADIIRGLSENTAVEVLSSNEAAYTEVRTEDGYKGFVETKRLSDIRSEKQIPVADVSLPAYNGNTESRKIVLGWHNVTNADANAGINDLIAKSSALNVISPTWFSLTDNEGNISSLASEEYVKTAHEKNLEVWGLVDDFTNEVDVESVLSYTSKRITLENNLMAQAEKYGLDGINIDFEHVPLEGGDDFAQFLRELSIMCRSSGIVLSADDYVPQDYSKYYRRDVQGKVCDYVIIMGYDEHTSGSEEAGSVASIDYVTDGITNTLKDVPADKVINAVPFYTRIWSEESGTLDSKAVGMADAAAFLKDNAASAKWDDATCQNYAQFDKDGVTYKVWMEDAQSIDAKLQVMQNNNLAGMACWKLGMETSDIWDVIMKYYPDSATSGGKTAN